EPPAAGRDDAGDGATSRHHRRSLTRREGQGGQSHARRPARPVGTRPVPALSGRGGRRLADAIDGAPDRFAREDMIEHAWRVVGPALDSGPVHPYTQGTWGPAAANRLPGSHGWHNPVTPAR